MGEVLRCKTGGQFNKHSEFRVQIRDKFRDNFSPMALQDEIYHKTPNIDMDMFRDIS